MMLAALNVCQMHPMLSPLVLLHCTVILIETYPPRRQESLQWQQMLQDQSQEKVQQELWPLLQRPLRSVQLMGDHSGIVPLES